MRKKVLYFSLFALFWLILLIVFICLKEDSYKFDFRHSCYDLETETVLSDNYSIKLSDNYCKFCSEPVSDDIYVYKNSSCEDCGKIFKNRENFCTKCGGTVVSGHFVSLDDSKFSSISNIKFHSVLFSICNFGIVISVSMLILMLLSAVSERLKED